MNDLIRSTASAIQHAFADTPYPGDENVAAYARYGQSIADALRGKPWPEVTLDILFQHRWEIFLLAPDSFRYYLPAFMLAALFHGDELDTMPHNLVFSLTPQRNEHIENYFRGDHRDYFSKRAAALNTPEKEAVLAFLQTFSRLHPGEKFIYDIDLARMTISFWQRALEAAQPEG